MALIAHGLIGDQLESEAQLAEAERIARTNYLSVIALQSQAAHAGVQRSVLCSVLPATL